MAMDFPNSPTNGTTYTQGTTTWTYDGSKWNRVVGTIQGIQGAIGIQGTAGFSGSNGAQGTQGIQGFVGTQGTTGAAVPYQSTAPSTPATGQLWANSTDGIVYVYNGSSWVATAAPILGDQMVLMTRMFV